MVIPFHKPVIGDEEIAEIVSTLKSGWLTTGPKTKQFEVDFAKYVGAKHAVALNSATAALHLALEAIGLGRGDVVLVPTMTFAATAEVVRYFDAKPILVDCREDDFNLDVDDARRKAEAVVAGGGRLRAIIPVHFGGQVVDMTAVLALAKDFNLRVIEDAAHCCPAYYRDETNAPWKSVGSESEVTCYSFYANKCITTGEGGMACTNDDKLADRMRIMALHGISKDAWKRFTAQGSWYYEIVAPGYKYNLTDIAASIGLHQLRKANSFRNERARVAEVYRKILGESPLLILPSEKPNRVHSWHLFAVRIAADQLRINRAAAMDQLKAAGVGASVHWIPLHMHPYYREVYGYKPSDLPVAARVSQQNISLPLYPGMTETEICFVAETFLRILRDNQR